MVTKGIVLGRKQNTNLYTVRIPYFESAGGSQCIFDATLCAPPNISEAYNEGDVVQIAFEDRQMDSPVIIGKLFTLDEKEARGFSKVQALEVSNSASLPSNTTLGGVPLKNILEVIGKDLDEENDIPLEEMPTIRVTSLSYPSEVVKFNEGDVAYLNVVVEGNLKVGDEITICERTKSKENPKGTKRGRVRYRYKTLKYITITSQDIGKTRFSIPIYNIEDDRYVFSHNNSSTQTRDTWRYVRIRRKIPFKSNCKFSNIERILVIYRFDSNRCTLTIN